MIETRRYSVAGHIFCVTADDEDRRLMTGYEPFAISEHSPSLHPAFELRIVTGDIPAYSEDLRQEDEGQTIICGKTADSLPVFEFQLNGVTAGCLTCSEDYREGRLIVTGRYRKLAIDNALMVAYVLATAAERTVLFHAAVVSHGGKGYMFIGPGGTGKSTHAALWRQHIAGVELINDDNPVVRISDDGRAMVYGSPWSGKTPCYRNVSCPLGAIVTLSQAPHNRISRLNGVRVYAALLPNISGKRWDKKIADGLHDTENWLAKNVPVWHLECLPDREAAEICNTAITVGLDD